MKEKLMAWILSIVVAVTGSGCAADPGQGTQSTMKIFDSVYAAETPEYPQMAQYPNEELLFGDNNEAMQDAWNAWYEQRQAKLDAANRYSGKLDHYLQTALPVLMKAENGGNAVCSPLNIWMALAMTAESAGGETRSQLLDLLGAGSIEELRTTAKDLWIANYNDDGASTTRLGASLWLSDAFDCKQDTLKTLADQYYAAAFRGQMTDPAFSQAFRDWLNEHTGGLLENNVAALPDFDPNVLMALATTIYFNAKWSDEFSEQNTYPETFRGANQDTDMDFLHASRTGDYYWEDNFSAVQLSFEDAGSMWLVLPDEGVTPEQLLNSGEALSFLQKDWDEKNGKCLVIDMAVPKFDVTASMDLKDALCSLGLSAMFDPQTADFSNLTDRDDVFIGSASHDARVKIDEKGCEAAAFTVMLACGSAMPPEERVEFRLDRPFLFFITGTDGLPLFCGLVNTL